MSLSLRVGLLLLSDEHIRLHDLRSPASYVAAFTDLVDHFSAIYSLLPVGCGRFLAGGSNHSLLKVFDMRKVLKGLCCGSSLNHSSPENQYATITDPSSIDLDNDRRDLRNWNIFLTDKGPTLGHDPIHSEYLSLLCTLCLRRSLTHQQSSLALRAE